VTDLYEAGDINQSDDSDEVDDDINDEFDDSADNDINDSDGDDSADIGNEVSSVDGGTPLAVLNFLARSLANDPDAVVIETEERRGGVRLNLHVGPEDMGRVIGRRGRTAQAIRTLVNVAGAKDGVQASVDIVDD
jgi:predicted RNA-binding protein YlqC (UPF0109 family)